MKDEDKTKDRLIKELAELRQRVVELGKSETELKRVEKKLRESEKRFFTVADFTYGWESWIGTDKRYNYVSPSCKRITGYHADEFLKDPGLLEKITHPEDRGIVARHDCEEFESSKEYLFNFRIITLSGDIRWIKHICQPVYDNEGNRLGRRCSNRDVTDRKVAEGILKEREAQYRSIFNSATDGFLIFDADGKIVDANPQACKMYGYSYDELITLSGDDIVQYDHQYIFKQFQRDIKERGEFEAESEDVKKDGTPFVVEVRGTEFDYKGEKHLLAIVRDITERKRADEALRESEERFRQLTENIQEVFWMTSTDKSKMLYVSPAYEEVWGRTRVSLYEDPRSFLDAIHPEDRESVIMSQREQIQKGYKVQYRIVRPDGSIRWIRDRAFPIRNEIGGIYRIAGIAEDITRRKEVEEKVLNYQKQLQSLASELSLAEERERRRIALWLHDQIGQTLAISRIKLGTLQESLPSTESCEVLDEIRLLIEQTIQSVRSLTFELSPPILYELGLEAALEWLTEKFQDQHGIRFEFEDDFKSKPLENDIRVLLFQAVRELLVNVAKHSQAHKTKVSIGSDGDYVRIKVEDDGIGLELSKVGPPWDKTCGFGLFSIRERLIPLGGDLEIKSEAGHGTRITLRAPKKQEK